MMSVSPLDGGNSIPEDACDSEQIDSGASGQSSPRPAHIVDCEIRKFLADFFAGTSL
jgi:hypothetical protein